MPTTRASVDLSGFPGLIVIYLGMKVTGWRGLATLLRAGPGIRAAVAARPEGLLAHEFMLFGPLHAGMRQYWRDLESLEAFTRAGPHAGWWRAFLKNSGGTGFWHEAYRKQGGMEGIYLGMAKPLGLRKIAPPQSPEGVFQSGRARLG